MRLVAYLRASTDRRATSPHTREARIREYCAEHGHELVRMRHEVPISGKTETEERYGVGKKEERTEESNEHQRVVGETSDDVGEKMGE